MPVLTGSQRDTDAASPIWQHQRPRSLGCHVMRLPDPDWYRNLLINPAPQVQVGNHHWTPRQRLLSPEEAVAAFATYERMHPSTAARLLKSMGNSYDGTDTGRVEMMTEMPMVAFGEPD